MRVARLKEAYPTAKVQLWCEDEHRPGLKPILRQGLVPGGREAGREGPSALGVELHLYAFARPKTGEVYWLILPSVVVNAEALSIALENFAREVAAGNRKRILLVLDQAGWHTAKKKLLGCPKG